MHAGEGRERERRGKYNSFSPFLYISIYSLHKMMGFTVTISYIPVIILESLPWSFSMKVKLLKRTVCDWLTQFQLTQCVNLGKLVSLIG
jgi:hypothetical protein